MAFNNRNNLSNESSPWGREVEQKIETNTYSLNQLRVISENNNRSVAGTLKSMEEVQRFTQPTAQLLFDMEDRHTFTDNEVQLSWDSVPAAYSNAAWRLPEKTLNIQGLVGDTFYIPYLGSFAIPRLYSYVRLRTLSSFNVSSQLGAGHNREVGADVRYSTVDNPTSTIDISNIRTNTSYGVIEEVLSSGPVYTAETLVLSAAAVSPSLLRVQPYCDAPYTSTTPTTCTMTANFSVKFEVRYALSRNRKEL